MKMKKRSFLLRYLALQQNSHVTCTEKAIREKETKPLSLYTEGILIDGVKKSGSKVEDEEARELMKLQITDKSAFIIETIRQTKIQTLTSDDYTGEW